MGRISNKRNATSSLQLKVWTNYEFEEIIHLNAGLFTGELRTALTQSGLLNAKEKHLP